MTPLLATLAVSLAASPAVRATPEAPSVGDAVARGAAILLELQETLDEGGARAEWPYEGVYRERGEIPIGYRVGGTAIAGVALCDAAERVNGTEQQDAERTAALERALGFVLTALEREDMAAGFSGSYDVRGWGHAYALEFLLRLTAEGRVPEALAARVDETARGLVRALESTEMDGGGWNYARGRPTPSTFMTAATLQVLFQARAQGLAVDADVVARGLDVLEAARLDTGAFQYATSGVKTGKGFEDVPGAIGRMPICEVTLLAAGRGDRERVRASLDAFFEHWEWLEKRRKQTGTHVKPYMIAPYYFFFAHRYAAQAIEELDEAEREPLRERLRELFWRVREPSGGWNDRVFPRSEAFGTAFAIQALCAPERPAPRWSADAGRPTARKDDAGDAREPARD